MIEKQKLITCPKCQKRLQVNNSQGVEEKVITCPNCRCRLLVRFNKIDEKKDKTIYPDSLDSPLNIEYNDTGLPYGFILNSNQGKYQIIKILGKGCFGFTYLGRLIDKKLNQDTIYTNTQISSCKYGEIVVVKEFYLPTYNKRLDNGCVFSPGESSIFEKYRLLFKKGAVDYKWMSHPNLIQIYDVFDANNTSYYISEYIEGIPLNEYIRKTNGLVETEALNITLNICDAIKYLHKLGRLHLDISPKGIIIKKNGYPVIIDFGLSKTHVTNDSNGDFVDTIRPRFSPLEQCDTKREAHPTLDIYAIGATLYNMITGEEPPDAADILCFDFPENVLQKEGTTKDTIALIKKAMEPRYKDRFQTVNEFITFIKKNILHDYEKANVSHLPIGTSLKSPNYKYRILKVLGSGAFGITYLAEVPVKSTMVVEGPLGTIKTESKSIINVAIKEFFMSEITSRNEDGSVSDSSFNSIINNYRYKFHREAENLSHLNHPNIIKVLEVFEANNTSYYSMEYIDGGSFDNYIAANNGISEQEALSCIGTICKTLSYLHSQNMLHLDLKPNNIMRRRNGDLILIDFGLSKSFDKNGRPETSTQLGLGTLGYAPLEQATYKPGKELPVTMDIYALGATLFKALTGETPPEASTILNEGFPEKLLKEHHISNEIILLTQWAMEPIKRDRPQKAEELLTEINRIQNHLT